jgi:hypothetical protein
MIIGMALAFNRPFENYEVEMNIPPLALVNRELLTGRFVKFDKTDAKWLGVLSAAVNKTSIVTVEGRAYKLESVDSEGTFKLLPS